MIAGGHLVISTMKKWNRARLVQDTPVVPVASAPQGFVEVEGAALPLANGHLLTPVEQKPSVYFSFRLEHYQSNGKSGSWVTVFNMATQESFYLADTTGLLLVNPNPGESSVQNKMHYVSKMTLEQKERVFAFAGRNIPGWLGGSFRVIESFIAVGSPVYALGNLISGRHEEVSEEILKAAGSTVAMGYSKLPPALFHSYLPKQAVCVGAMATTEDRKIYFADCHKEELESRLRQGFIYKIIGGALLFAAGAAFLLYTLVENKTI